MLWQKAETKLFQIHKIFISPIQSLCFHSVINPHDGPSCRDVMVSMWHGISFSARQFAHLQTWSGQKSTHFNLHFSHTDISIEKVFFFQQLLRYGTICGSGGEFVNCGVRKDGTMGQWNTRLTAPWEHTCGSKFSSWGEYAQKVFVQDYTGDSLHK